MSEPSEKPEIYEPLNADRKEIRLLRLKPNSTIDDELHCTLEVISLEDDLRPQYEAISYCWGEVTGTASIRLNGSQHTAPASAAKVLRRFRLKDNTRALWLDAICINQHDIKEKEKQIPLMRDIYSKCTSTLVWLGDSDEDTAHAVSVMADLTARDRIIGPRALCRMERYPDWPIPESNDITMARDLVERPWSWRTWVLQEVALAPSSICYCGPHIFSWKLVIGLMQCCCRRLQHEAEHDGCPKMPPYSRSLSAFFATVLDRSRRGAQRLYGQQPNLAEILMRTRYQRVSDVRDKVFGVLALITTAAEVAHLLRPDYSKTYQEVFRDATRVAVFSSTGFHLLEFRLEREALARLQYIDEPGYKKRRRDNAGLPTWVPRWDIPVEEEPFRPRLWLRTWTVMPDKKTTPAMLKPIEPSVLALTGYGIDEVSAMLVATCQPAKLDTGAAPDALIDEFANFVRRAIKFFLLHARTGSKFGHSSLQAMEHYL